MKIDLQLIGLIILFFGLVLVIGTDYSIRQILALSMMAFGAILIFCGKFKSKKK
ncbi:MAG: hypothetical protein GTN40_02485 [Candidatus Aenigmarchaeota archaeon]|nr:hypothetical protein [Candidatus Aenigmarchaeota archaeon]